MDIVNENDVMSGTIYLFMIDMYMSVKYILQKDILDRMAESNFGLKCLRNDVFFTNYELMLIAFYFYDQIVF